MNAKLTDDEQAVAHEAIIDIEAGARQEQLSHGDNLLEVIGRVQSPPFYFGLRATSERYGGLSIRLDVAGPSMMLLVERQRVEGSREYEPRTYHVALYLAGVRHSAWRAVSWELPGTVRWAYFDLAYDLARRALTEA